MGILPQDAEDAQKFFDHIPGSEKFLGAGFVVNNFHITMNIAVVDVRFYFVMEIKNSF